MSDRKVILYFADVNAFSRTHSRIRALADLGHTVLCVPNQTISSGNLDYVEKSFFEKLMARIAPTALQGDLLRSLQSLFTETQPDIFWADKPSTLSWNMTRLLRKLSPRTKFVLFSEDDLWLKHNRTKALEQSLREYDIVFTTKWRNMEGRELEQLGAQRVAFVTQACDPYQHFPQLVTAEERAAYGADVGFVGNYEAQRAASVASLAVAAVDVRVWGNGWEQQTIAGARIENAPVFNSNRGLFYSKAICATDINLGFLRARNRDTHTSRTFEIPACGGFLLAQRSEEHESLFLPDIEASFFSSDRELVEKAVYYSNNPDMRIKIAKAGFERCMKDHTSKVQMSRALELIQ